MSLRPLGHRIVVLPDQQDDTSASGLILPTDRHHVPTSGTVIEIGDGPAAAQKVRQAVVARCMAIVTELETQYEANGSAVHMLATAIRDEMRRYRNITAPLEGSITVGDRVVFPVESGLNVDVDGVRHLILHEDDVAVIAVDDEVAA